MPVPTVMPQPGEKSPAIDAESTNAGRFSLAEQKGRWVAVYFYPRANTPG